MALLSKVLNCAVLALCISVTSASAISQEVILGDRKIVGGEPTTIAEHPWQVALIIERNGANFLCGGSIIARRRVLTAAHCFRGKVNASSVKVIANRTNYREGLEAGDFSVVDNITIHEKYNSKNYDYDIALVNTVVDLDGSVIPLATPQSELSVGDPLIVTGWGATKEGGAASVELLKAEVPLVANSTCNLPESYAGKITSQMLCAGKDQGGVDSCKGDSGGPLVMGRSKEESILVGVVSFGYGCARQFKYGVYVKVAAVRDWALNPQIE